MMASGFTDSKNCILHRCVWFFWFTPCRLMWCAHYYCDLYIVFFQTVWKLLVIPGTV